MTDERNQITYKTIKIGKQTWFAENLNYNEKGSKCYRDNDNYCKTNGRQYDWATAKTACPSGWHLPSKDEWDALIASAGGEKIAGKKLKAKSGWSNEKYGRKIDKGNGNGTDDFGFSALPSGGTGGGLAGVGEEGGWWSTAEDGGNYPMKNDSDGIYRISAFKEQLHSVRCVQD